MNREDLVDANENENEIAWKRSLAERRQVQRRASSPTTLVAALKNVAEVATSQCPMTGLALLGNIGGVQDEVPESAPTTLTTAHHGHGGNCERPVQVVKVAKIDQVCFTCYFFCPVIFLFSNYCCGCCRHRE